MTKRNRPLELLNKHRQTLTLEDSLVIENENDLFKKLETATTSAVVFLPKSKALIDMTLALISGMVEKDGEIALVGEKSAGIESAKKAYEKYIGPVEKKIIGNHSVLYVGNNKKLTGEKKIKDFLSYSPLIYKDIQIEVVNLPGIFSAGELDEGTQLLLDHIPYDRGKVLDMGSGAGIIGALYKKISPASEVVMSDWSKLAVLASQKTLEMNRLQAEVVESDLFQNIKEKFDLIVCNPPFHKGMDTDYSFIENFAEEARKHLNRNGAVYIVANSFLPYGKILEKFFKKVDIVADTKKYKVYKTGL